MATDATGTPTSPDNIPTYNVNVDDPTGNGFNAAMAAIQTALSAKASKPAGIVSGEVPVWNGSTWVRSSVTNVGPTSLGSGTPDATKFLRGDGTWASAGVTTTTSTMAGGPPGSPADKDVWIATAVDANGTRWAFQYNSGSASSFKWEFIGGPSVQISNNSTTSVSTSWVQLTGMGLTIARAGDYQVRGESEGSTNAATWSIGIGVGGVPTTISQGFFQSEAGGGGFPLWVSGKLTGLSAGSGLGLYMNNNVGAVTAGSSFNLLEAIPVRIS